VSCDLTAGLPCWLDVDLDAIAANVASLTRWLGPATGIAAVVKADGYGSGATAVAPTVLGGGARGLAVARVHEGARLRDAGIQAPILVLNRTDPVEGKAAVGLRLTVTVDSVELARQLDQEARRLDTTAAVHLKIDTGLHRFGVDPKSALILANEIGSLTHVAMDGLYTHFASADEPDLGFAHQQLAAFHEARAALTAAGHVFRVCHAANSAATLAVPAAHLDLVRVGLSLYGVSPIETFPAGLCLQPALALRARVARVFDIDPGEGVGYGQTWHADRATRVALVTAGYADGIPRRLSNRGRGLVRGHSAPIIGRVSMDQTTIDVTGIPGVRERDIVTLFGRDGAEEIGLWEFARDADGIAHDALTSIGSRVARVYWQQGIPRRAVRLDGQVELPSPLATG
jgi:alanine racemase